MAENLISQIKVGTTTYDIKDAAARTNIGSWNATQQGGTITEVITDIKSEIKGGTHFLGVTSTEITDGGNQKPVISPTVDPITPLSGDIVVYGTQEFIFAGEWKQTLSESGTWHRLGDQVGLGDLAYKNDASTTLTQPTWTGDGNQKQAAVVTTVDTGTLTASAADSSVTLSGGSSIDASKATLNSITVKSAKTLPTMTVSGEVLTFNAGETEDKSVFENSVHASSINFVAVGENDTISQIVTASPTGGTATGQTITIEGAPSVDAYLPGEETTITVS